MKKNQIIACIFFVLSTVGSVYGQADDITAPASYNSVLQNENKQLKKEVQSLNKQLWTAQNTAATSNRDVSRLMQEVANYKTQIANLQAQLTNAQNNSSNNATLQANFDRLSQRYEVLLAQNNSLKAQNNNTNGASQEAEPQSPQYNDIGGAAPKVKKEKKPKDSFIGTDAKGRNLYRTPEGNRYYINENGGKTFLKAGE
jgi:chromosome segregation ATPase